MIYTPTFVRLLVRAESLEQSARRVTSLLTKTSEEAVKVDYGK